MMLRRYVLQSRSFFKPMRAKQDIVSQYGSTIVASHHATEIKEAARFCEISKEFDWVKKLFSNVKNRFENELVIIENRLRHNVECGIDCLKKHDLSTAMRYFDAAIALIIEKNDRVHLSEHGKTMLAEAYTKKANILRIGSEEDEKMALACLDEALDIVQDFPKAVILKRSLLIGQASPEMVHYRDDDPTYDGYDLTSEKQKNL